ncbi:glycosyltransferase [Mesoflavibacter zeaxanthinifaciens]|uniref:glycosyltransferase n=1 Tax=Mesoflavibacter zeaxanthinifaciens TaxID=393060 RepID=UPI003A8D4AC3
MSICIVSPFFHERKDVSRPSYVRGLLIDEGYDVITITSDFSHVEKKKISFCDEGIITVKTIPYKNNVSLMRFLSHLILSIGLFYRAYKYRNDVDCFYITAPFALTAMLVKIFTGRKVLVDIVDYWPNSLPIKKSWLLSPFLYFWYKTNYLSCSLSDRVISVSSNFLKLADRKSDDLFLLSSSRKWEGRVIKNRNELNILYLGNIGTLYDFDSLMSAVSEFQHKTVLHIVGDGDNKNYLLESLRSKNIDFVYYGIQYDKLKLKSIIDNCDIGFNGYINTNATFSYKALSYFSYGLPIINSMSGDLYDFVSKKELGVNYLGGNYKSLLSALNEFVELDKIVVFNNVINFFELNLENERVNEKMVNVFKEILHEEIV